jgi:hypothetical protein
MRALAPKGATRLRANATILCPHLERVGRRSDVAACEGGGSCHQSVSGLDDSLTR